MKCSDFDFRSGETRLLLSEFWRYVYFPESVWLKSQPMPKLCYLSQFFSYVSWYSETSVCLEDFYLQGWPLSSKLSSLLSRLLSTRIALQHSIHMTRKLFSHLSNSTRVWLTFIHFCHYQLTVVANWRPICHNIFDARPETYHHCGS